MTLVMAEDPENLAMKVNPEILGHQVKIVLTYLPWKKNEINSGQNSEMWYIFYSKGLFGYRGVDGEPGDQGDDGYVGRPGLTGRRGKTHLNYKVISIFYRFQCTNRIFLNLIKIRLDLFSFSLFLICILHNFFNYILYEVI